MKFIGYTLLGCVTIVVLNIFAIQRDKKMFDAYDHMQRTSTLTPYEKYCRSQARWHPDCNVE